MLLRRNFREPEYPMSHAWLVENFNLKLWREKNHFETPKSIQKLRLFKIKKLVKVFDLQSHYFDVVDNKTIIVILIDTRSKKQNMPFHYGVYSEEYLSWYTKFRSNV